MGLIKKFADYAGVKHEIDPTGHSHTTSEGWLYAIVGSLTSMINGKAASVHTHTQSDVTGLTDALAGKAASAHTHTQSDVTGLTDALAGKAASAHTHTQIYNSDSLYVDVQESQGSHDFSKVRLEASAVSGTAVTSDLSSVPAAGQYPSASRNKIVTSGAIKDALDEKASKNKIEDEEANLKIVDGYALLVAKKFAFELSDIGGGEEFEIDIQNAENLMRALGFPDSAPTASSDNLITSGAVYAALHALELRIAALEG